MPTALVLVVLVLSLAAASFTNAGQVDWSSSAFSIHQTSDGTPLDDSFVFELGAFTDGFVPTGDNAGEWATHWRVADRTDYNPETEIFAASHVVASNEAPFGLDALGYIWGFSPAHPGEWILVSSPVWKWPTAGSANPPVSWTVGHSMTHIVGNVQVSGDPFFLETAAVDPAAPIPWVSGPAWRSAHFSEAQIADGTADWEADPDGDGLSNLTEMGLNTDPLAVAADSEALLGGMVSSGDRLELSVVKAPNHDVDYLVEVSGDLVSWSSDAAAIEVILDSPSRLIVRDRTPLSGIYQRFIRLTVVLDE